MLDATAAQSMTPLGLTSYSSASLLNPCFLSSLKPIYTRYNQLKKLKHISVKNRKNGRCRAEFSGDVPVAMAIGACILNSLVFPVTPSREDMEAESLIDSADARFAVMAIISFIPYFNWMSWVFAWMDTGRQRYAVYAIVYLAPYLRENLSISPEDSWLPISSILLCILHIQLEASAKNGDLQGFQVLNEVAKRFSSPKKNKKSFEEEGRKDFRDLPSAHDGNRDEIRGWSAPPHKRHLDHESSSEDEEDN